MNYSTFLAPRRAHWLTAASALSLLAAPALSAAQVPPGTVDGNVRSTIVPGEPASRPPGLAAGAAPARGDITLNFPNVEVAVAAKSVLGDILGLQYTIDPAIHATLTLRTGAPVMRGQVLPLFEEALRGAGFALVPRGGVYAITPLAAARGAMLGPNDPGYGDELIQLRFANGAELRKLLDTMVPNTVSQVDPATNTLVITGNTFQRGALRDLVQQFDVDWLKGMSFAMFVPQHTDSRLIAPELDRLLNNTGAPTAGMVRVLSMDSLNGILAVASQAQQLQEVQRWVEVLDREGEGAQPRAFIYRVQNGRSADLAKVLNAAFGGAAGGSTAPPTPGSRPAATSSPAGAAGSASASSALSPAAASTRPPTDTGASTLGVQGMTITSDDTTNSVVVVARPREYAVIEEALRKLDLPPVQVLIDASITEVTLNDNLRYGVQWLVDSNGSKVGFTQGKTTAAPTQIFPGLSYFYQNGDITATLNALSAITNVTVLSAPKLMVLNNNTASLQVGDQVPVATGSSVSTASASAPIVSTIEYRDTGVILKVTPRVNDSGQVQLDIAQEVSDVSDSPTSSIDSPTIQQRRIATTVAVQNGETLVLGGLIRNTRTRGKSGIPLLSAIPFVGALFGESQNDVKRTELLVLLTPTVVRSVVDARAITDELSRKIRSIEPTGYSQP